MHRMTDNRCSMIVDRAERKRLLKKSKQRMAAVKSPMKISVPKKANTNTKRILLRRMKEQRIEAENLAMLERLKRASARSSIDNRSKMGKYKKQFKHNKSKVRQQRLEEIMLDNYKLVSRLAQTPPSLSETEFDRSYFDHVNRVARIREIKDNNEGFHANLAPPTPEDARGHGALAYSWRPKTSAKLREMPMDIFSQPRARKKGKKTRQSRPATQGGASETRSVSSLDSRPQTQGSVGTHSSGLSSGGFARTKYRRGPRNPHERRRQHGEFKTQRDFAKIHAPATL